MRRSSFNYETQDPPPFNKNNVEDLIYRYESRKGAQLHEILSSPHLQRELDLYYGQSRTDFHAGLMRMRPQQRNESLTSLTDSEFFSDDRDDQTDSLAKEKVADNLTRLGRFLDLLSRLPLPLSFTGMGICFLLAVFICPRTCCENLLFPAFRLAFGTLYPAYASYKAVRTKNVKEYVKWMMYWIVYAFFTCIETFTDIFLSWFPFYYEFKVIIVLWLLSPATKGSSTLYRKFVHPMLTRREQEIDEYLNQAKERGYTAVLQLGSKGVNYATNVIMQTALKGGGNLVQTLRRSYSLSDLSEPDLHRTQDEMVPLASSAYGFLPHAIDETQIDEVVRPQRLRPRSQTVRSSSGGRQTMYFSEVDVEPKIPPANYNYIRSSEDISSGYSSAEPISGGLSRTSSMTNTTRPRFKAKRAEDESSAETDEYDSPRKIRTPIHPSPYMTPYKINPIKESSRATCEQRDNIEEWKDEVFFSNEQYFQEHQAAKQASDGGDLTGFDTKHMSPEMCEKYEIFCKWLESNEANKQSEEELLTETREEICSKLPENIQRFVEEPQNSQPKDSIEDEFRDTISAASDDEEFVDVFPENKENVAQTTEENVENDSEELSTYVDAEKNDENFEKTQSTENIEENAQSSLKRLDAFAKVVVLDSENSNSQLTTNQMETQIKPDLIPDSLSKVNSLTENKNKDFHLMEGYSQSSIFEVSQGERKKSLPIENLIENLAKETEATLSVLKTNLENSGTVTSVKLSSDVSKPITTESSHLTDSAFDLSKRPVNHTKGKAPEPPESLTKSSKPENLPLAPPPKPIRSEIPSSSFRESTASLRTPEPVTSPASHSRSPSPKPEGKSKSKKSLFKNYLPSLFRSEPAKQTPGLLDEYHKETQI